MPARRLWTEWHLTPCGWVRGSEKTELGSVYEVEPAVGRVLSCRYGETYDGDRENPASTETDEVWRSADPAVVEKLVGIFGECPKAL